MKTIQLTYRSVYLYQHRVDEHWAQIAARPPIPLSFGWLPQAEALAFDGRSFYVNGEHVSAPIQVNAPPNH